VANTLILYSTTDGHTKKICERIQDVLEQQDHVVTLVSLNDKPELDLSLFDKIVIGASIRYGKHRPEVTEYINGNTELLTRKPGAFFSVNVTARKPNKNTPETNPYMPKFLKQIHWQPTRLAVFAGKIDYPRYTFFDRSMIRFIMWITKGPTDRNTVVEFTDWQAVENFAHIVSEMK
jgi:menaquinone-dependent protoporphyrinogen oxidase